MYVKIYGRYRDNWSTLWVTELTKRELVREKRLFPHRLHLVITGKEAHAWVRDGGVHGTSLYIDADKRIRRAG